MLGDGYYIAGAFNQANVPVFDSYTLRCTVNELAITTTQRSHNIMHPICTQFSL